MLNAISRYGARVLPNTQQLIAAVKARGEFIQGPQIAEFERAFEKRLGSGRAISTAYGRMAFYYMLKALDLPPGSEIVVPALTFWVIPALAQAAGLKVVFADIDPDTFLLDPAAFERVVTDKTRVVVPTHLYGLPCEMDDIVSIAARHNLFVIEDCAHALGAVYRGRPVGTFGTGALFSFQTLKPLNTYGGGMALVHDQALAQRVADVVSALPWPGEDRIRKRLFMGRVQRILIRPNVFTWTSFPILWVAALWDANPDVFLWEKIRPLHPLPQEYTERYSNVQAVLGLESLKYLDQWTAATRANARRLDEALKDILRVPGVPPDRTHVYYQYCAYGADRDRLIARCVRGGIDIESLHVDVCPELTDLFPGPHAETPGATRSEDAIQVPVYASLTDAQIERIGRVVRRAAIETARKAGAAPADTAART
jgi:dTDP-4-amino-4,6-dideoxygalactose transaminase